MKKEETSYNKIALELCDLIKYKSLYHESNINSLMPSIIDLKGILNDLKEILFIGFIGAQIQEHALTSHVSDKLKMIQISLKEQIKRGLCFNNSEKSLDYDECEQEALDKAIAFIESMPKIKQLLLTDIIAAYNGDPAARSYGETILCYPSIEALTYYRVAHELYGLGVELIPRMIMEILHSKTGIDIHPGAKIGKYFFIDHGTGVVIGETTIIGDNVRLYQGVTLGAKSFQIDEKGNPIKGIERHPIIYDNVIIYSNATILGRVSIGENSIIGGNTWITEDIPANSKIFNTK
ncbi:MAG: Serine O-acetyltransferase [Bacteroidetes bacterium]|nr:Serine O-acetyltransferase [Bacteroidota bacterium]